MSLLALDLGTLTGWCLDPARKEAGTLNLSIKAHESSGMRLVKLRGSLKTLIDHGDVTRIAFESATFQGKDGKFANAAHIFGELLGVVKLLCEDKHIDYVGLPVASIKKRATGKGNANKEAMMAAARKQWPDYDGDDNEADARWIWVLAREQYGA